MNGFSPTVFDPVTEVVCQAVSRSIVRDLNCEALTVPEYGDYVAEVAEGEAIRIPAEALIPEEFFQGSRPEPEPVQQFCCCY